MNIIFMGTPDFAVPSLEKLVNSCHSVKAVFTQPDKPVGRKQILMPTPVKVTAQKYGIPVYQPDSLKNSESVDFVKKFNPDAIIVVAYGKILPKEILNIAKYGCINVHASLLPKYRGAAPIQWAVINGDNETGVSIMQMDDGLDTGDILSVRKVKINIDDTSEDLFNKLAAVGAEELLNTLVNVENGLIKPVKQPDGNFFYATKITKELSPIDWSESALKIHNKVRGLQTWPCAVTSINGKNVKIHKTKLSEKKGNKSGQIVDNNDVITVCCGDGNCIEITELQPDGKKRMSSKAFLAGNIINIDDFIGNN